ncbi:hypothetical protein OSB04_031403 [Centaurea solstitialis]|uniref:CCHC-type domain-containing protein n=1 Tax=Centaurea solstitialis TaxID=347529 RepID=A0AA38W4Q1_9ASTR|nr:hypothetical protein OSB04_031403 [Centaurea solstitialis]
MASTVTSTNNLSLRFILEKDKLTGSNFLDWERNLMIVLRHERKWYVLEEPLGEAPPANAPAAARNAHKKHSDDLLDVSCLMLATMSPDLQAGLINTNAYDMIRQLRDMFQTQARTERYDATKAFNECKMIKGTSVSDHVMKMKRHLDHLERLGHPVPLQLATDTILNSLSEDYRPFVVNYNMNNMEKTIAELHSMLKTAELNMGNKNKTKDVLMVKDGGVKKKNGHASTSKGKGPVQAVQSAPKKGKSKGKGKKVKPNKVRTENRCFTCNEVGHWRQNCPKRHEAGRNHPSTQQLRKVAVSHIQELEVSPGSYDQLLNNSYKRCRLKVAQIFDRVANIGRDPRLRLLLGISHRVTTVGHKEEVVSILLLPLESLLVAEDLEVVMVTIARRVLLLLKTITMEGDSVLVSKVPMLKPNEFYMWKIRIRQYILLTNYAMWDVIENGPDKEDIVGEDGRRPPPKSDAQRKSRQIEMKALSTLLLAIPNEYQNQFCNCANAKALFNKLIGELATCGVKIERDDVNRKFLRSLGEEWTIYTAEVEAKNKPIGYTHNAALMSNDSTAFGNTTASESNTAAAKSDLSEDSILEAFLASHVKSALINEDLEQINADDLEEMDIKWQMAI